MPIAIEIAKSLCDSGESRTFKTGDGFVIPNGFSGYWEVLEHTVKHYAVRKYPDTVS